MSSIVNISYSITEKAEIKQWITTSERLKSLSGADQALLLDTLNDHLASRTTLLGDKPSEADVSLYRSLAKLVSSWSAEQRAGERGRPHIVRHLDFIQNSSIFKLSISDDSKIKVNPDEICYIKPPSDLKHEKKKSRKDKTISLTTSDVEPTILVDRTLAEAKDKVQKNTKTINPTHKLEDKSKEIIDEEVNPQKDWIKSLKPSKQKVSALPISVSLIDLRVGHILKAIKHPEAETLYVSTIAMGDKPGTDETSEYKGQVVRTVCSGLNGLIPLEEMQDRKVIVVCNLKPVKMRGIKSAAMVLAASPRQREANDDDHHHSKTVELVSPPEGAVAGEKVFFEGWKGEPKGVLNPKKKIWETFQIGFTTTDEFEVGFQADLIPILVESGIELSKGIAKLVTENGGICKVNSLAHAVVR